jgi:hypothetical protein
MLVRRVFRDLARHPARATPHALHKADHEDFQKANHERHETHENFQKADDKTPENFRVFRVFRGPAPPARSRLPALRCPPPPDLAETVLVRQGRQVARSYQAEGYSATWRVELGIVEFYDAEGRMLLTVNLFESLAGQRMAA